MCRKGRLEGDYLESLYIRKNLKFQEIPEVYKSYIWMLDICRIGKGAHVSVVLWPDCPYRPGSAIREEQI